MLRDLLRAMNCASNPCNAGYHTNADKDTAAWLNGERCHACFDRGFCLKLYIVLEDENNMRNSVEAITKR